MSTESVLIPAEKSASGTHSLAEPRYSLLLSTDPVHIEAAQRLRYDVFSSEPGFALTAQAAGLDVDRFDEHCDHLLVREENSGELVGCYRMLPPRGAAAAGGLYSATESTSQRWIRCGRQWWRWDARWCTTIIATARSYC
jgi:putative hemolysin